MSKPQQVYGVSYMLNPGMNGKYRQELLPHDDMLKACLSPDRQILEIDVYHLQKTLKAEVPK